MSDQTSQLVDMPMLSNFVHQVINPLNGVVGTLDNILDGTTPPNKQRLQLGEIRAQLEHSIELIRNLAYLSGLSSSGAPLPVGTARQSCTLPEIIIQAAQYYQGVGRQNGIALELSDPKTQYLVEGHPALLRQAFMNILENGVKYSDPQTKITVTPRPQKKTGDLLIEIESFGPGFDVADRDKIFGQGYRGRQAIAMKASGSGLGLFITKRLIEAHGWTIDAEYTPGDRRTVFRLRVPTYTIGDAYNDNH